VLQLLGLERRKGGEEGKALSIGAPVLDGRKKGAFVAPYTTGEGGGDRITCA